MTIATVMPPMVRMKGTGPMDSLPSMYFCRRGRKIMHGVDANVRLGVCVHQCVWCVVAHTQTCSEWMPLPTKQYLDEDDERGTSHTKCQLPTHVCVNVCAGQQQPQLQSWHVVQCSPRHNANGSCGKVAHKWHRSRAQHPVHSDKWDIAAQTWEGSKRDETAGKTQVCGQGTHGSRSSSTKRKA